MNYGELIDDCFEKTKLLLEFMSCLTLVSEAQRQVLLRTNRDQIVKTANEVITTIDTMYMDKPRLKNWTGADKFERTNFRIDKMRALADVLKADINVTHISEVGASYSRGLL